MSSYRFPVGVKLSRNCGSMFTLAVSIPTAEGGFFGSGTILSKATSGSRSNDYAVFSMVQKLWCVNCSGASAPAIGSRSDSRCDLPKGDQT